MSTYREIHGKAIKSVSTDPSDTAAEGQVWYNTVSNTFKSIVNIEAWSSASAALAPMHAGQGFGSQTDAVGAGGYASGYVASTDEYNGSGWAAGANIGTARYTGQGCGSQTAGLIAGGNAGSGANLDVEEYNGTSWAEQTNLSTGHGYGWMAGIQTAAICYSGLSNPSPATTTVNAEEYNGSSWTEVGNVNTGKYGILGFGATQDTAVKVGGTPANAGVEEWNGSSWTAVNSIPANRADGMGSGSQTAGIITAGNPGAMTSTLTYDGTNWTTSPATLGTGRAGSARGATISGNATSIIHHAGPGSPKYLLTEEYNSSINVITGAAWAAGGSVSTVRTNVGSTSNGTQNAAMVWGGRTGPPPSGPYTSNKSDEYNGTSFTATPNLNLAARTREGGGTTTAAWCAGGEVPTVQNACEEYDGSSWTSVTAAPLVFQGCGTGVQTAGLIAGLVSASPPTGSDAFPGISLEYDGTNWATGGSPSNDRYRGGCSGTQTAGTLISGYEAPPSPNARVTDIEEYNGSSWTSGGTVVTANAELNAGARGPQTATLITGGFQNPSPGAGSTQCSTYDGTATATTASMGTGRRGHGSDGGQTSGIAMTGQSGAPPVNSPSNYTANAEALTAETTAINVKTLTQS